MTKQPIRFIAADMDGTLLDEKGVLDNAFFALFDKIEQNNILFAAASGRQYYSLLKTFEPIKDRMLFIAENGTMVMHQGNELYSCSMDKRAIKEMIVAARAIDGTAIVLCGKESAYIETQHPDALEEFAKYYERNQYVDDLLKVDDEFIKVALCHFGGTEDHVFPTMNKYFGQDHKVVVSAKIWLDIMHKDASKGAAIKSLQQQLGFTIEQTMSFGDYLNDIEMLQESGYSYAMENAHDDVKKIARFLAPSNQDRGVLTVIEGHLSSLESHRSFN